MTEILYTLHFHGNLHIGSGAGIPGILDERVMRDPQGFAYLPATTVKGLVRQSCIDLLHYRKQQERAMCQGQRLWHQEDARQPKAEAYCQDDKRLCLVCLLFGSPLTEGAVWFSPAQYVKEYREVVRRSPFPEVAAGRDMAASAHAAIDRQSGRAKEHLLFNLEVVHPAAQFEGKLRIIRPLAAVSMIALEADLSSDECLGWLVAALLFTRAVGGRRRRGWGQCRFTLSEADNPAAFQAVRQL